MTVFHVDGPACSFVEWQVGDALAERIIYRTFCVTGANFPLVVNSVRTMIARVEHQVALRAAANESNEYAAIIWRMRPAIYQNQWDDKNAQAAGLFVGRFRLATLPDLSTEQWAALEPKNEGEPATLV